MATQSQQRAANVVKGGKLEPLSQKNTINGLLSRSIKFRKSRYVDHKLEQFKQKFAPVNGVTGVVHAKTAHAYDTQTDMLVEKVDQYGFEQPMKVLFSKDKLSVGWQEIYPVGSGLKDMGHLSSLNAVLQVLTYTPALANFLMNRTHGANCTIQDYCFLCAVEEHVRTALKGSPYALQPRLLVGKLKKMSKKSSSKDAFDVWAYFMEQMQSFLLSERTSKDTRIQETTALYQMFGGYIQKKFTCPSCNALDHFYDSFLYLSLDLTQCSTVERCVSRHFKNKVSLTRECSSCQHEGQVECTQSIYRPPMNLVIQLDRFDQQSKNNKMVKFEERMDIRYAVTETERGQVDSTYQLYGIIVHTGESLHDGHYVAYVKSSNGIWYCMDNETVQVVSLKRLLEQNVYMLFYHNIPPKIVSAKKKPIHEPATSLEKTPQSLLKKEEEVEVEEKEEKVDDSIEDKEKEDALRKAIEEASHKEKRENEAAIVVRHDETMQSKRDKLDALIQREEVESKSAEVKQMLLTKVANNQFQDEIDTWEDTGVAQKRNQVLKQMKTKRKKVDSYDLDYDRGKLKKVKSKKKDDKFNKPNMFQLAADMKKKK